VKTFNLPPEEYALLRKETDEAIKKGYDHSKAEWRFMAFEILYDVCRTTEKFSVNDFRNRVLRSEIKTHDNRALGGPHDNSKKDGLDRRNRRKSNEQSGPSHED